MLFVRTSWNNVYENSSLWVDKPGSLTGAGTLIAVGQQFRHLNRFLNFIQQVNVSRISLRMPQQDLGRLFSEDRSSAGGSCSSDIIGHKDINACTNTSTFDGFAERVWSYLSRIFLLTILGASAGLKTYCDCQGKMGPRYRLKMPLYTPSRDSRMRWDTLAKRILNRVITSKWSAILLLRGHGC